MKFQVVDRESLDVAAWERLAGAASFFHTVTWADVCAGGLPGQARAVFFCGLDEGRLVIGMPAVVYRRFGFRSLLSMPGDTYGGVIGDGQLPEEMREIFFENMDDYLAGSKFSMIRIADFHDNCREWKGMPLERHRCMTHLITLDDTGEYSPPDKKISEHIQSGKKTGAEVVNINTRAAVDAFYDLYRTTERRHGHNRPIYGKGFFLSLLHHAGDSPNLVWIALEAEGEMVGARISFIHGDVLFNWQAVSNYEKRRYKANQVLLGEAIDRGLAAGVRRVNLGASPPGAVGLIDYKERWGGVKTEYDVLVWRSHLRRMLGR